MRTGHRLASFAVAAALIAGCTGGGGGGGGTVPIYKFRASKVTVVNHNDSFLYGVRDEPFVYNLWFRVKVNEPNSAQVGLAGSRNNAFNDLGDGQSHVYTGAEQAEVNFANVALMDLVDFFDPAKRLEIVGTWTWAMDQDDVSVAGVANDTLTVLKNVLNATVAAGTLPANPEDLVSVVLGDFGTAFSLIAGALFGSIPGIPDDPIGSRFYIGIGTAGALGQIVDTAALSITFPTIAIPIVSVPPDIGGGHIFSLGHNSEFTGEVMDQGNGRHDYSFQIIDSRTINQAPIASFTATPPYGSAPLTVNFDSSASNDPDGTIVSRNWSFGDFTTGSGTSVSHTFTSAGTYPVLLTVTDALGESASKVINVAVGGAPTVAPTGLTKVGSGCCNTYGDFAWNMVPGATDYEIDMDAYLGGGCLSDHGAVINGQVSSGRVQAFGLCLGSHYNTKIRAKANGQWGPWSSTINIVL